MICSVRWIKVFNWKLKEMLRTVRNIFYFTVNLKRKILKFAAHKILKNNSLKYILQVRIFFLKLLAFQILNGNLIFFAWLDFFFFLLHFTVFASF